MEQAGAALLRTAWLLTGDHHRAHELTQAALVKTYVAWPRVRQGEALAFARRVRVVPAGLGQSAGLIGAAALVLAGDRYWPGD